MDRRVVVVLAVLTGLVDGVPAQAAPGGRRPSPSSVSEAVQLCRRAARWAATHGQLVHEVLALQTAVRFGDASGSVRLAELDRMVEGPRAAAAVLHARGVVGADPDVLLAAADGYLDLGDRLSAADAYAQAAVVRSDRARSGARSAAVRQALSLRQECGAITPALRAALHPLPLAPREREVATMAAHGLPNRVIAARLQLSVRTVEGHLYRAFGRLGVGSREDLEAAVGLLGA